MAQAESRAQGDQRSVGRAPTRSKGNSGVNAPKKSGQMVNNYTISSQGGFPDSNTKSSQRQLTTVKFTGENQNRQVAQSFNNNYPTVQSDLSFKQGNTEMVISSDPANQGYVNGRSNSTQFRV